MIKKMYSNKDLEAEIIKFKANPLKDNRGELEGL